MNINLFCNLFNENNIKELNIIDNNKMNIIENNELNINNQNEINIIENDKIINNNQNEINIIENNKIKNKKVSFNSIIRVILIPTRIEEKYNKFISHFENSIKIYK